MRSVQEILAQIEIGIALSPKQYDPFMYGQKVALENLKQFILKEDCPHTVMINGFCRHCGERYESLG